MSIGVIISIVIVAAALIILLIVSDKSNKRPIDKKSTKQELTEVLSKSAEPKPNQTGESRSKNPNSSDSFELYGNDRMSLSDFLNIVRPIRYGEEFRLVYESGEVSVYYEGLLIGTRKKYERKTVLVNALQRGEEVFAMCAGNDSWYGDQKDRKFFNIGVEWQIGPGNVTGKIADFKQKKETLKKRISLMDEKKEAAELKKTNPQEALDFYLQLLPKLKEFNKSIIGSEISTYVIRYPLNDAVILANKLKRMDLLPELLEDFYTTEKHMYTANLQSKFDNLLKPLV